MKTEQQSRQSSHAVLSGAAWGGLLLVAVVFSAWLAHFSFVINGHRYFSDAKHPAPSAQTDAARQDWVNARRDFGFHPSLWLNPLFRRDYVRAVAFVDGAPVHGQSLFVRKHTPNGE